MKFGSAVALTVFLVFFGTWSYADDCNSLRYVDNGDGTMTDCRTGLIWLQDANCLASFNGIGKSNGWLNWFDAMKWVVGLQDTGDPRTGCQLSDGSVPGDWRLPSKIELMAMITSAKSKGYSNPVLSNAGGTAQWTNGVPYNFQNVQSFAYWSCNTASWNQSFAWQVSMFDGNSTTAGGKLNPDTYVWPVRGGQDGSFGVLFIQ